MTLATTVALAVVRGPVPVAKTLGAIDRLSGGRLVVAVGPGSSRRRLRGRRSRLLGTLATVRRGDRRAPGAVAQRRCAVRRPLLFDRGSLAWNRGPRNRSDRRSGSGAGAPTPGFVASPVSPTAGWRRPTTRRPQLFGEAWQTLACEARRSREGRRRRSRTRSRRCGATSPTTAPKPSASSTSGSIPTVHRPEEMLRERLPIGPPELFAEKLTAFAKAGVQRVFIWPVADEVHQLERFWNEVRPLLGT